MLYVFCLTQEYTPGENGLIENLHTLLTSIEDLYETGKFNGPEERFFGMVEKTASMRPVSSSANATNLSNTPKTS